MRPIPEGRHPGQPSRRPCVRRARGAATTPTRFLPKYPDPIFLRCGKPRAAVLAGDAVAWLARRCVIFGFGGFGSSSRRGGRPRIAKEVRDLIRRMSLENPRWGATKVHGELLKLGIDVAQSTVSIYMVPRQDRPLQTWKTFLRNHMEGIASIDLFMVPTIAFHQLSSPAAVQVWEEAMKTHYTVVVSMLTGIAIGAVAVQSLRAQAKPPVYYIAEVDVTDPDGYAKEYVPKARSIILAAGGRYLAAGSATPLAGEPPKSRVAILVWDNMEQLQTWFNSPEYRETRKIGEKYAKYRNFAIPGLAQ
jgi:uncharacterized protein (DUF1330 family)